ncbi:helix-turn-helix transcriptional regulator [Brevibacterium sp. BDJS002]|uniref:helix-turn-helix domain-containing protein n=1 Tax=Brevibacterium sp. BDJS002 TaxID=3020906 RepID=UPI00230710B6|nr:helix-turn-helix transcriptional regulator [Brevibacterium sp. BDJS002]WCE39165.1 helix-turn-helix transcriptional regulator [Brevibacterium sp. BDJS002]
MSDLSDRLADAKQKLGISTQKMSDLAQDAGYQLSNYSATVYTNGKHPAKASTATLDALAYVLRIPVEELRRLAGLPQHHGKFEPTPAADTLTAPQRTAVNEIIRQLAEANEKAGEGNADSPTPMNQAGGKPATGEDDGLGAFGGRARGDLDHESKNDGAGGNVHRLFTPPPERGDTAAYDAPNRGKKDKEESEKRGEESQDPEDWE